MAKASTIIFLELSKHKAISIELFYGPLPGYKHNGSPSLCETFQPKSYPKSLIGRSHSNGLL